MRLRRGLSRPCSTISEGQLGISRRDGLLKTEGSCAHSALKVLTLSFCAFLLLGWLQFVDQSTNHTSENTDLDCSSPVSSAPFHRQELPINGRAGNLKKKKQKKPGNSRRVNRQRTLDIKGSKKRKRTASTPPSEH